MPLPKISKTQWAWIAAIAGLGAYETWTLMNNVDKDTLSEETWRVFARRPLVVFLFGMLVGHFVWQSDDVYKKILTEETEADGSKTVTTEEIKKS